MSAALRLARRDLKGGLGGLGLLWLCLAIAIAGLSSVTSLASLDRPRHCRRGPRADRRRPGADHRPARGHAPRSAPRSRRWAGCRRASARAACSSRADGQPMLVELTGRRRAPGRWRGRWSWRADSAPATARSRSAAPLPSGLALKPGDRVRVGAASAARLGDHRQDAARVGLRLRAAGAGQRSRPRRDAD